MKRIVFIGYKLFGVGGVEKITSDLSEFLSTKYDIFYITLKKWDFSDDDIRESSLNRHRIIINIKHNKIFKMFKWVYLYLKLLTLHPDKIILQSVYSNYFKFYFGLKKKIIFVDHGFLSFLIEYNYPFLPYLKGINLFARKVVVLTKKIRNKINELYPKLNEKLVCIPNFLNLDKDLCGYSESSKTIVSCGRLDKLKKMDLLIECFKEVCNIHPDWLLEIYGDGEERDKLQNLVYKLGIQNNVFLKGSYIDIYQCYSNKSFFVLTSSCEGFSLVLLEAKYFALPAISNDCFSGPSDLIKDGKTGFLIKNNNKEQLISKMRLLIENSDIRNKMSCLSKSDIDAYSKENVLKAWHDFLSSF